LERRWTQAQAAEATSLDLKHLQKIEAGTLNVSFLTLIQLARGLQVSVAALVPYDPGMRQANPLSNAMGDPAEEPMAGAPEDCTSVLATLGGELGRLRRLRGLSQSELAQKAGLGLSTVRQTETGKKNLTISSLVVLAGALGVRASDLLAPTPTKASAVKLEQDQG
jgi:transcriptional regulator with XRE-family HTH domain